MIKCIAIDDEPLALEVIKLHAEKLSTISLEKTFLSVIEGISYLSKTDIDIVFLDINMPELNGLKVRSLISEKTQIVFITAYEEYALESYDTNATDYILKPVSFERFFKSVKKCEERLVLKDSKTELIANSNDKSLVVRGGKNVFQIKIDDINYIEGLKDYAKILCSNNERIIIRESLKRILERLEGHGFVRVHRSFIVPISKINSITGSLIRIGEVEIPLSKSQRENVLNELKKHGILGDRSN